VLVRRNVFFRDREGVCEPVCQGGAVKSIRIIYLQNIEDRIQSSVVAGLRLERKIFALILDSELIRVWKLYQNKFRCGYCGQVDRRKRCGGCHGEVARLELNVVLVLPPPIRGRLLSSDGVSR